MGKDNAWRDSGRDIEITPNITPNEIYVCHGPTCHKEAPDIMKDLKQGLGSKAKIQECGCLGLCGDSNNLSVNRKLIRIYQRKNAFSQVEYEISKQNRQKGGPISEDQADEILGI